MDLSKSISEVAQKAIEDHTFPGCVVGVVARKGDRHVLPFGNFTYDSTSGKVAADTIYDMASVTKSIPTASIALQLIDEGKLKLTDKLIDFVPEFRNADREGVLIKHLLTFTLDGYSVAGTARELYSKQIKDITADEITQMFLTRDFEKRPGEIYKYTSIPTALLTLVIERVTGSTLAELAQEHFFTPLHMTRTTFSPSDFPKEDIVPTEEDGWRGLVQGVVHDETSYIFKQAGKDMGYAGLFSTAPDMLNFLEMLLHEGEFEGKRYFSKEIVATMGTNQIEGLDDVTGLGWELNQPRYMSEHCTEHTFAKTGFTGTLCVVDVGLGVAYVILSNRIYPKRPEDSTLIHRFRKEIGGIVLGSVNNK